MTWLRQLDGRWRRTERRRRVLAICGDTQVGLWMVRSLARNGVKVLSAVRSDRGLAAHSRYSSGVCIIESSPATDAFADEVEAIARQADVGSIMTISEGYHNAMIACRDRFEPAIKVFSPERECFDKATDKDYMQRLCRRLGVPVAEGTTLDQLPAGNGCPLQLPLVLRTRVQNIPGGKWAPWKAAYAADTDDLARLRAEVEGIEDNVIVQEYHPGAEDHVQVLMHRGEAFALGEYIGEHHMPLAGGVTVQRVTCRHEGLLRDAVRVLAELGWEGIAGVQFHYEPATDEYIFLEINPRFIGGLPTVIMAGFEAPFLLWQSHFEPRRMIRPTYQLGFRSRILGGDANWVLGMVRKDEMPPDQTHLPAWSAALRFLWNTGPWTADDALCLTDPKPAFVDWVNMARRLGAKTHDIIGNPDQGGGS
jgi:predicted ATP-grasp superfamily ATP-dependent carboligase